MRIRYVVAGVAGLAVLAGAGVDLGFGIPRSSAFQQKAQALRSQWDENQKQGVPAASLDPLRQQLTAQWPWGGGWWSPVWVTTTGQQLVDTLQAKTTAAWNAAVSAETEAANTAIDQWQTLATAQSQWIAKSELTDAQQWPVALQKARTPAEIHQLTATWQAKLRQARTEAQKAENAYYGQMLSSLGGRGGLISAAQKLSQIAKDANLDDSEIQAALPAVQAEAASFQALSDADLTLLKAVEDAQALVNFNNQIAGSMRPVYLLILQAQAESTPNSGALSSSYNGLQSAFQAARTMTQLQAVQQAHDSLQSRVSAELSQYACGHNVPSGKAITINLTLQEMIFYQDGCAVQATPVSTGRPQLRTPPGYFHIFAKYSPFIFHSMWPPSSPFWYPDSPVSWVMEFSPSYFIHDAPWEWVGAYGPGSENNNASASHGCVHTPTPVMGWAYSWTPIGTPVIISY